MAKSKSTPSPKSSRTRANKEQTENVSETKIAQTRTDGFESKDAPKEIASVDAERNTSPTLSAVQSAEPLSKAAAPQEPRSTPSAFTHAVPSDRPEQALEPRVASEPPRKMEVVKTEARNNVVPINLDEEIRRRAYELFQQRSGKSGSEADDWLVAEREVRQRYRQESA